MLKVYDKKENCCGCTACMNICPKSAITMQVDQEGFLYPRINQEKCVDCGLCYKVCTFQNGNNTDGNFESPYVYAVKNKDESVRMSSSSGGVFAAISDYVLGQGGVVFGAAFDENMDVIHQKAENKAERDKFKGSKYVQSDLKNIFSEVRDFIIGDRFVLFTGTPCQVAGLNSFLGNIKKDKLYMCDIVCHGVPSPLLWRKHVNNIELRYKQKLESYSFRDKRISWHGANIAAAFYNSRVIDNNNLVKAYSSLYFSQLITRPSCHNCKYTNFNRPSDITIADFWGIEKCMPEFDDNKGISLVLVNTPKGEKAFDNIKENLEVRESNVTDCLQPQLQHPSEPSPKRQEFWKDYYAHGYGYIIKKYAQCGFKDKTKQLIRKILTKTKLIGVVNLMLGRAKVT